MKLCCELDNDQIDDGFYCQYHVMRKIYGEWKTYRIRYELKEAVEDIDNFAWNHNNKYNKDDWKIVRVEIKTSSIMADDAIIDLYVEGA
jgi:hypothetical protein